MNKGKQIEKLIDFINDIDNNGYAYNEDGYEITGYANARKIAEALVEANYCQMNDVLGEIQAKLFDRATLSYYTGNIIVPLSVVREIIKEYRK